LTALRHEKCRYYAAYEDFELSILKAQLSKTRQAYVGTPAGISTERRGRKRTCKKISEKCFTFFRKWITMVLRKN
jgi:hypothetical protein